MGIKQYAILLLSKIAGISLSVPRINDNKSFLTILVYHRISYHGEDSLYDDIISATPEDFELQMPFCKKYFTPITFSFLKKYLDNKEPLPRRSLIITFDDGYRDNYTYAFPILRKYEIPATFFLTTGYVGTKKLLWWDAVACSLKNLKKKQLDLEINHKMYHFPLKSTDEKIESIRNLVGMLKKISINERTDIVSNLTTLSGLQGDKFNSFLDWDEVKKMSNEGFEFGSHSVTHPTLTKISTRGLTDELRESKRTIEDNTGKNVIVFAYPFGGREDFNRQIEHILQDLGYNFAVSYIEGVNPFKEFNRFALKRIGIDGIDLKLFKAKLAFPTILFR